MEITKKIYYSLYLFFSIFSLSNCVLEIPLKPMVVKGIPKYKNITRVEPEKNLVYNNSTMLYEEGNSFVNSEYLFVSTIKIGSNSQTFNLIMDTGSSVLWVAQPNCKGTHKITRFFNPSASSTARGTTQPMKIQYGTGYAEGYFYNDNFEYLSTRKFNLYFGLAYTADFLVTDADGIVGLSKSYDETGLSFIHMMKSAGNTDSTAFSFKFESDIFDPNIKGSMFIGEHEDFSKSEAISAPLTFYGNKIFWACEISSFSMKGKNYETKSNQQNDDILDVDFLNAFHHIDNRGNDQTYEKRPNIDLVGFQRGFQKNGRKHHAHYDTCQNGNKETKVRPATEFRDLSLEKILEILRIQRLDGINKPLKHAQHQRNSPTRNRHHVDDSHQNTFDKNLKSIPQIHSKTRSSLYQLQK